MRVGKKSIQVSFHYVKKDQSNIRVDEAFDFLFDEVFRLMNEKKPSMAMK